MYRLDNNVCSRNPHGRLLRTLFAAEILIIYFKPHSGCDYSNYDVKVECCVPWSRLCLHSTRCVYIHLYFVYDYPTLIIPRLFLGISTTFHFPFRLLGVAFFMALGMGILYLYVVHLSSNLRAINIKSHWLGVTLNKPLERKQVCSC